MRIINLIYDIINLTDVAACAEEIQKLIKKEKDPVLILLPANIFCNELAARIAVISDGMVITDCIDLQWNLSEKKMNYIRPDHSGTKMLYLSMNLAVQIITLKTEGKSVREVLQKTGVDVSDIITYKLSDIQKNLFCHTHFRLYEKEPDHEESSLNIESADCLVAGGIGMGQEENFLILKEFARLLHGEIAVSRPIVDAGWISSDYQVGLSGKTVHPHCYIACGISGAMQHVIGMEKSDWVMAINIDRNEPIFNVSDIGIIGDAKKILPMVIEKIKKERRRSNG